MMRDHGVIGRHYAGAVTQIISGSIGFDDWEWGVDLFADDPVVFKKLIYEMRFDEASALVRGVRPVLHRAAVLARGAAAVPGGRGARADRAPASRHKEDAMSPALRAHFADYATFHATPGNKACHYVAVPIIVLTVLALLARVELATVAGFTVTLAEVVIVLVDRLLPDPRRRRSRC